MQKAQREIGEVEITVEELNAVSGGTAAVNHYDAESFRNALIKGFCGAGGKTGINSDGVGVDFHSGGNTVTIHF